MATVGKTAEKTAKAVQVIEKAGTALAKKFNLEIKPFPKVRKFNSEFGQAVQLEYLANLLTDTAIAANAAKRSDFNGEQNVGMANEKKSKVNPTLG